MKVGFIGTGKMGKPMATNIQKAGHDLVVHDLRRDATESLLEGGAAWADNAKAVTEQSEVLFGSLPKPVDVEQVFLAEDGILAGMHRGQAYFDLTTSDPAMSRTLAAIATEHGVHFLDSPVSGGTRGAEAATLAVMVGGDREVFEKYRPLLSTIGKNVFYLGGPGNGNVAKLVNNMLSFVNRAASFEGLILGTRAGVDPQLLLDCVRASSGSSAGLATVDSTVFKGDFSPTFTLDLACKDMDLALTMAKQMLVPMRVAPIVQQLMIEGLNHGLGEESSGAVMKLLEQAAGLEVRTG